MKTIGHEHDEAATARRWTGAAEGGGVGPQGAALILELQRLRQAFEREPADDPHPPQPRRPARNGQRPPVQGKRAARPKRPPKGKMGRAFDSWLGPFEFHGERFRGEAPARSVRRAAREPDVVNPHRARGPIIAPDDPSLLNVPMPGLVLKVLVKAGEAVHAHQTLVVLEAMKMEHAIEAPYDGVVKSVNCAEGGRVAEGFVLIEMEREAAT